MNNEYETAQTSRRIGAFIIDFFIVFLLWHLFTDYDLKEVNAIIKSLDPVIEGSVDILAKEVTRLYVIFMLKFIFVQTLYYTLVPAVFGRGKTFGKLIFGISMLDVRTLKEVVPTKLILREFLLRCLFETLLVVPLIVSSVLVLFTKKSLAIHDLWAGTVVITDSSFIYDEDE